MSDKLATVFLRLEGPLQAWATTSRHSIRATGGVPSKSGVVGLVCSTLGLRRSEVAPWLPTFNSLKMGVRVDRPGRVVMDYHTSGAKIGLMSAQGKVKITQTTGEIEPQVSRCYYLADANFLVALQGNAEAIERIANGLQKPVWPAFLGRKSCPPSTPIFAGVGDFPSVGDALASLKWHPRTDEEHMQVDGGNQGTIQLRAVLEPNNAQPAWLTEADVAVGYLPAVYRTRFIVQTSIVVPIGCVRQPHYLDWQPHSEPTSAYWHAIRKERLQQDYGLCVFCKQPAEHVHHVTYKNAPFEEIDDLRSVCRICHDALTMIEYSDGRTADRLDPCEPKMQARIVRARERILEDSIPLSIRRRGD